MFAAQPLLFTENRGQVADTKGQLRPDILFTAHNGGAQVFVTAGSIEYQFVKTTFPEGYEPGKRKGTDIGRLATSPGSATTETHHFSLILAGANSSPVVRREARNSYTENFYLSQCPQGINGVATYERIVLEGVYPGIDWVIYSNKQGMKYDFVVHPGADASLIKLRVKDADAVSITPEGRLVIKTRLGEVSEDAPVSFSGDEKVATRFVLEAGNLISIQPDGYDHSKTLTIDPAVVWSTYYGIEIFGSCAVDGTGNVYYGGTTEAASGIASGGYQNTLASGYPNYSNYDACLIKFNSAGSRLWGTYYGTNHGDLGYSVSVTSAGDVYLAGITYSPSGIATTGAYQTTFNSASNYSSGFLVKFNTSGTRQWATYVGGNVGEDYTTCATDGAGNVFFSGTTFSTSNIASGGYQNTFGGGDEDLFLIKFNSSGARQWATYYGGERQ